MSVMGSDGREGGEGFVGCDLREKGNEVGERGILRWGWDGMGWDLHRANHGKSG